jgi:hypothetical protein
VMRGLVGTSVWMSCNTFSIGIRGIIRLKTAFSYT